MKPRDLTVTTRADTDVRRVTEDDADLDNTAVVQHPGDPNPDNDRDTTVVPVDHPDLVVDKDDGLTVVAPGDGFTYTVAVRNIGPGDAQGIVVSDDPAELEYVGGSEGAVTYAEPDTVTWPAFDLAAAASRELTVVARVREDVPAGTVVHNIATAPTPEDPNPEDNADNDRDDVDGDPPPPRAKEPTPRRGPTRALAPPHRPGRPVLGRHRPHRPRHRRSLVVPPPPDLRPPSVRSGRWMSWPGVTSTGQDPIAGAVLQHRSPQEEPLDPRSSIWRP